MEFLRDESQPFGDPAPKVGRRSPNSVTSCGAYSEQHPFRGHLYNHNNGTYCWRVARPDSGHVG